jgi:WD40 repeat protein
MIVLLLFPLIKSKFFWCVFSLPFWFSFTFTFSSNKWLLTGSLDASVKLWALKQGSNNIFNPAPTMEFSEHDYPVYCVAISNDGDYGAAGAEDGTLTIWDLNAQTTLATYHCSQSKR